MTEQDFIARVGFIFDLNQQEEPGAMKEGRFSQTRLITGTISAYMDSLTLKGQHENIQGSERLLVP